MNTLDVLKYGHQTVLGAVEGLPEADWQVGALPRYGPEYDIEIERRGSKSEFARNRGS